MHICSSNFYSGVYSMPYVTSLILNPARVYPKAVAVVERYYQQLYLRYELRRVNTFNSLTCGCGGIGRRTRFRSWRFTSWGFESLHPYQDSEIGRETRCTGVFSRHNKLRARLNRYCAARMQFKYPGPSFAQEVISLRTE